jgi:hypothetical protein
MSGSHVRVIFAIGVVLIAFSMVASAQNRIERCPNLSGEYSLAGEDGGVSVTIKQRRCERIQIEWWILSTETDSKSVHTLLLDGQFRPDTGWFGDLAGVLTSARFHGPTLEIVTKRPSAKDDSEIDWQMFLQRAPNGDVCHDFNDRTPHTQPDAVGTPLVSAKNAHRHPPSEYDECRFQNAR